MAGDTEMLEFIAQQDQIDLARSRGATEKYEKPAFPHFHKSKEEVKNSHTNKPFAGSATSVVPKRSKKIVIPSGVNIYTQHATYTVAEKITGCMSGNYIAHNTTGREFVIKTGLDVSLECAQRIANREERALKRLAGTDAAPRLHDKGNTYNRPFLVISYINGEDLSSLIKRTGAFPNTSSADYFASIASQVGVVHRHNIVHRDLKPDNVRYRTVNTYLDTDKPVILDFGLALIDDERQTPGTRVGTPAYASPEQQYDSHSDKRSDIYALGVILCEMLTGRNPFSDISKRYLREAKKQAIDLRAYDDLIDSDLAHIVLNSTQPDPGKRYQNTDQMIEELKMVEER